MLVWWHASRYKINYSHFFRGGWRSVLKWCNVRAHKRNISVSTIDFRPALMYESTSADLRQQLLTCLYAVCGALFVYKRESTVVSSVVIIKLQHARRRFLLSRLNTFRQPFVTKFGVCGAPSWAGIWCKKIGILVQVTVRACIIQYFHSSYILLVIICH